MKRFPLSTILGLTLGVLLAFGVAVSAFQSPTQAPPQGNVPAPLNTGPADQTKTGGLLQVFGLWVNQALGVSGGATFGGTVNLQNNKIINVGTPSLAGDVATKGYMDSSTSSLQTRVSGSCPGGQGIQSVASNGSVSCEVIKRTPVLSSWTNSYGSPNTEVGTRYGDSRSFTVPADSGGFACSYFGFAASCNGCFPLAEVSLTCDGGAQYNVPIIYQITFQRIEGHSPVMPGTAQGKCFLNVRPQGISGRPIVGIDGRCRSANVQ